MKYHLNIAFLIVFLFSSCDNREQKLRKKELELAQKEQELLLKEKELEIREQHLAKLPQLRDSLISSEDSVMRNDRLPGKWAVEMKCIETDCEGSAIGDTKNEVWEISYQNNTIIAKAKTHDKLVRVYTGQQKGKSIELLAEQKAGEVTADARIFVKLKMTSPDKMEGRREIFRSNCKIVYSLNLARQ